MSNTVSRDASASKKTTLYISLPLLLQIKFHYLPESLAIVFLGAVLGLLMTALPEAETKRVCLNESTIANGF